MVFLFYHFYHTMIKKNWRTNTKHLTCQTIRRRIVEILLINFQESFSQCEIQKMYQRNGCRFGEIAWYFGIFTKVSQQLFTLKPCINFELQLMKHRKRATFNLTACKSTKTKRNPWIITNQRHVVISAVRRHRRKRSLF